MKFCFIYISTFIPLSGEIPGIQSPRLIDCYQFILCSLLRISFEMRLSSASSRVLFVTTVLFGMSTYWIWEADLTAYFVSPKKELPFNSLEGFLNNTDKKVIFVVAPFLECLLYISLVYLGCYCHVSSNVIAYFTEKY